MPPNLRTSNRITIPPETAAQLRGHAARSAVASMRLLRNAKDKPQGLTSGMIENWLTGRVVTARPEHLAYVLARWSALPDKRRVPLTAAMIAALNTELVRTGLGPVTLLRLLGKRAEGLTRQVVQHWMHGTTETVDEAHWDYLITRLTGLPNGSAGLHLLSEGWQKRRAITPDELAELRAHRERTSFGGAVILRNAVDIPAGLTPDMISRWLSGNAKTANPRHIAYVLARYRAWG